MGQEGKKLSRRDLFKVGTAIAGVALLQPSLVQLAVGKHEDRSYCPDETGATAPFPNHLRPPKLDRPNVVFIVLDTVRADHLSCYGYRRETTPKIDAFAAGARVYKNALSPSCFTGPTHASFFTGLSCSAHGTSSVHPTLDSRFETLAEQLQAKGYQTVGLASNGMLNRRFGFDRGFQTYWCFDAAKDCVHDGRDRNSIVTAMHGQLAKWLTEKYDARKPFFLFLNYIEAHQQYRPPREQLRFASTGIWDRWQEKNQAQLSYEYMLTGADSLSSTDIAEMESLYDDAIGYNDRKVGEVLEFLKATGLEENTLVIIAADHGEHFGERHLLSHQYSLYEPLVRVPLIVRYADHFKAGEEDRLVQSHDVYPTILELAGVPWKRVPGQTCQSLLEPPSEVRTGISEYLMFDMGPLTEVGLTYPQIDLSRFTRRLRAIQRGKMKLIRSMPGKPELYDLVDDPIETRDLADQKPDLTRELAGALDAWTRSFPHYVAEPAPRDLPARAPSADELKVMRGLGYIQ